MRRVFALLSATLFISGAAPSPELRCAASRADGEIFIPAGRTTIGDDSAYAEEHGRKEAYVPGFHIDRHEITNRQFARFVAATGYVTDAEKRGDSIVFQRPDHPVDLGNPDAWWKIVKDADWRHPLGPHTSLARKQDFPVVQVSLADAMAYAQWAGRALPTENQFERAARAGNPSNTHEQPALDEANTWQGNFPDGDTGQDGHAGLAPAGCYKANGFGLRDMIGNAWEWTASSFTADHRPGSPAIAEVGVIKGGSYLCTPYYCARYRPSARQAQDIHGATSHISFRTISRKAGRSG